MASENSREIASHPVDRTTSIVISRLILDFVSDPELSNYLYQITRSRPDVASHSDRARTRTAKYVRPQANESWSEEYRLISGFTFALEQRKTYTVGRDKACDIRFESRYVKPIQGRLTVGDWDPNNVSGSDPLTRLQQRECPERRAAGSSLQ